jgi:hypothetical protein
VAYFDGRPVCYFFDDAGACPWPAGREDRLAYALQPGRLVVRELGREVPMALTTALIEAIAADLAHQSQKGKLASAPRIGGLEPNPLPKALEVCR